MIFVCVHVFVVVVVVVVVVGQQIYAIICFIKSSHVNVDAKLDKQIIKIKQSVKKKML